MRNTRQNISIRKPVSLFCICYLLLGIGPILKYNLYDPEKKQYFPSQVDINRK